MIEKKTTHIEDALARLVYQFRTKTRIRQLVSSLAGPYQDLENVLYDLMDKRILDKAFGAQLDGWGEIVGIARRGKGDTQYRRRIKAQIAINTSRATAGDVFEVLQLLTGAERVWIGEYWPAHVEIFGDVNFEWEHEVEDGDFSFEGCPDGLGFSDAFDPSLGGEFSQMILYDMEELKGILQDVVAGGVEVTHIGWFNDAVAFSFDGDPKGLGFGDVFDSTIGGEFAKVSA